MGLDGLSGLSSLSAMTKIPVLIPFVDDFDDNSLNTSKWQFVDFFGDMGASVSEQNQRIEVALTPNTTGYAGIRSVSTNLNFVGKEVVLFFGTHFDNNIGFGGDEMILYKDANNYIYIGGGGQALLCRVNNAGVLTDQQATGFADARWKIVHNSGDGKAYFYAWDSTQWVEKAAITVSWVPSAIQVQLQAGYWGTGGGAQGPITFTNFTSTILISS